MQLALIRHGIAEDAGPATGYRDEPRRLTEEGIARMQRAAEGIARLEMTPQAILCSPLPRCEQTAHIIGERLEVPVVTQESFRPGARVDDLLAAIAAFPDADCLMVCGHQPDLSMITSELIGGGLVEFRKGSMAVLELHRRAPGGAVLEALHPPKALRALA